MKQNVNISSLVQHWRQGQPVNPTSQTDSSENWPQQVGVRLINRLLEHLLTANSQTHFKKSTKSIWTTKHAIHYVDDFMRHHWDIWDPVGSGCSINVAEWLLKYMWLYKDDWHNCALVFFLFIAMYSCASMYFFITKLFLYIYDTLCKNIKIT